MAKLSKRRDSVVISQLSPLVECGAYPAKRIVGERFRIEADLFKDGHDVIVARLLWRKKGEDDWREREMHHLDNDRWGADVVADEPGEYHFRVLAWPDSFQSWLKDLRKRIDGGQEDFLTEIEEGRIILNDTALRAATAKSSREADDIESITTRMMKTPPADVPGLFDDPEVAALIARWPDLTLASRSGKKLRVRVEEKRAGFSAWYEFFPRSAEGLEGKHSTLRDCLPRVRYAREMGFDTVYFPPIHPIGVTARKGKNNTLTPEPDDVGSPWAIGNENGGHRSIEPALGTIDDFVWLVNEARAIGIEIAMDFAINCSPDHPYVADHPEWFFHRPDGSIRYAENPPKKYQDIYPLNFHCDEWQELWQEMLEVVLFWIDRGVRTFRVDNPHTKPVAFWEWLIAEIDKRHDGILFLSEAFTKPKMMRALAKIGFTQSYTYFTWRLTRDELIEYVTELTRGEMRNYFRANFWPNTPDILAVPLQNAPPSAFKMRATLAATLSTSWGIYSGYEFCENDPFPGKEEYNNNEKYQLKARDWNAPGNIKEFIRRLNGIRRDNPAFHFYENVAFVPFDNDRIIAYYRWSDDRSNLVLVLVNLDPENEQAGTVTLPLDEFGIDHGAEFQVTDLMYGDAYTWRESTNFVILDPASKPVHVLKVR